MTLQNVPALPPDKRALLASVADRLRDVPGVEAIVLGGSWARGMAGPESDLDVGLYYEPEQAFSIATIRAIAEEFSVPGSRPTVTEFYEWGPWVNGGAWIQTTAGKLDFLYSNLTQVRQVIEEAKRGVWRHDYDQQPPYGFRSVIFLAETKICVPLYDPHGAVAGLKKSVAVYPPALKQRIVQDSLWCSEFTLAAWRAAAERSDVYCAAGCATRVAQYLAQALFALNEEYCISDKNASRLIGELKRRPSDYQTRMSAVLGNVGDTPHDMLRSLELLEQIWRDAVGLSEGLYQPAYDLKKD